MKMGTSRQRGAARGGRKHYRYHAEWRQRRDENKFGRMVAFARALLAFVGACSAIFRYFSATHIIMVNIPGCSLHTQPNDPKAAVERPPGGGIGLSPEHMNEIAILLPSGAPVSME